MTSSQDQPWPIKLFRKSPLKKEKFRAIVKMLGDTTGKTCLDIGSDNGVISYLLRQRGGEWSSADLTETTVDAIRGLVHDRVYQIDGRSTPFESRLFDCIVVVDLLEHIETDREFLLELDRLLKPGGLLLLNVPNPKEGPLRRFRFAIGQTDEAHGHLRPGYSFSELKEIVPEGYEENGVFRYSRLFSVLTDTTITLGLDLLKAGKKGKKGTVVTGDDMSKQAKNFKLFSILYPFLQAMVWLDRGLPFLHGNMLLASFKKK